jgi:hypothetical protein
MARHLSAVVQGRLPSEQARSISDTLATLADHEEDHEGEDGTSFSQIFLDMLL